jgi:hypothetical protein
VTVGSGGGPGRPTVDASPRRSTVAAVAADLEEGRCDRRAGFLLGEPTARDAGGPRRIESADRTVGAIDRTDATADHQIGREAAHIAVRMTHRPDCRRNGRDRGSAATDHWVDHTGGQRSDPHPGQGRRRGRRPGHPVPAMVGVVDGHRRRGGTEAVRRGGTGEVRRGGGTLAGTAGPAMAGRWARVGRRAARVRIGCQNPVDPVGGRRGHQAVVSSRQTSPSTLCRAVLVRPVRPRTGSSSAIDRAAASADPCRPWTHRPQPRPASTSRRQRWPSRVSSTAIPRLMSSSRSRSEAAQSFCARAANRSSRSRVNSASS